MYLRIRTLLSIVLRIPRNWSSQRERNKFACTRVTLIFSQAYFGFSGKSIASPNNTITAIEPANATARLIARHFGERYSFGGGRANGKSIMFYDDWLRGSLAGAIRFAASASVTAGRCLEQKQP
eukprot:TRINITY_DN54782_c0_g1_i1.p1 TRINITY_DN54782_c0_g1~~TRINITY_DN54782_c0_g1_i1.p1  ORF type:complete len:124 (+),score=7.53 TRINITY_DN54782_c0_g1_i1:169-540(+)